MLIFNFVKTSKAKPISSKETELLRKKKKLRKNSGKEEDSTQIKFIFFKKNLGIQRRCRDMFIMYFTSCTDFSTSTDFKHFSGVFFSVEVEKSAQLVKYIINISLHLRWIPKFFLKKMNLSRILSFFGVFS